jgi:hypothetical protein
VRASGGYVLESMTSLDGLKEILGWTTLDEKVISSGGDDRGAIGRVNGQDDDPYGRPPVFDEPGGFQPVELRHPGIHEDDVRLQSLDQLYCLLAIRGFTDDLGRREGSQECPQPLPGGGVVIGDEDTRVSLDGISGIHGGFPRIAIEPCSTGCG